MRGKFITFEGGEGSGKSTQLNQLADWLSEQNIDVVRTREPGGAPEAEIIRTLLVEGDTDRWQPITEILLHYSARAEHLARTVIPALKAGQWVLSDRFADSTMAYQGYGHGFNRAVINQIHHATVDDLKTDLTLVFDVSVPTGLLRAGSRQDNEDRYERMGKAFHERVRQGFLDIAASDPDRCKVIDAEQDIDLVLKDIKNHVSGLLAVTDLRS